MPNLLTCTGFGEGVKETALSLVSSDCIVARFGLVLVFFVIAIIRKWGGEEVGLQFSFVMGLVGALSSYLLIVSILGSFKIAFVLSILIGVVLGYGSGMFTGGEY